MRFRTTSLLFLAFAAVFFITSCDETDKNGKALSTPTSGELNLSVDETLSPIFKEELIVFNQTYPQAKIKVNYESEFDAITDFRNKKSTMLVLGRKLTQEENAVFEQRKLPIKYTKIAYDAIALIINKDNPNKEFKYEVMENIFSGKINNWTDADGKTSLPITVVFDDPKSSIFGTICNRFKINKTLPKTFFGLHSNPEVIDYVSKNKGAIGIIGVNWISNYKVKAIQEFNAKIDVAGVYNPDTSKFAGKSYKPYQ
ncbi:MAG: substrate-binding domain-containing protein, partial [Bacteroidetes bacterium]|nr:substrate-binding domain-containing protein [Bacteroidota bacterium]